MLTRRTVGYLVVGVAVLAAGWYGGLRAYHRWVGRPLPHKDAAAWIADDAGGAENLPQSFAIRHAWIGAGDGRPTWISSEVPPEQAEALVACFVREVPKQPGWTKMRVAPVERIGSNTGLAGLGVPRWWRPHEESPDIHAVQFIAENGGIWIGISPRTGVGYYHMSTF